MRSISRPGPLPTRITLTLASLLLGAAACGSDDSSTSTTTTSSGTGGAGGAGGGAATPEDIQGCAPDIKLYQKPVDAAARGPSPVGAISTTIGGLMTEIWYPAKLGSEADKKPLIYNPRQWLPASEQLKIPDNDTPFQNCDCYYDLPLDDAHGPYPVVVFLHGAAGFRTQSLTHMVHWASRGFVVVAADYPGLYLADILDGNTADDLPGDTTKILDALKIPAGNLTFLTGHLDMTRVGMVGHSEGGGGLVGFSDTPGVRVLIPLASAGTQAGAALESTLIMGAMSDAVVNYKTQTDGYMSSPPKKRLVGLSNTGHLFPSDLCWLTAGGKNIVELAQQYMVKNADLAAAYFDCPPGQIPREAADAIVGYSTAAVLEETLHCTAGDPFEGIESKYPAIGEYQQEL